MTFRPTHVIVILVGEDTGWVANDERFQLATAIGELGRTIEEVGDFERSEGSG
jgi:hypothetical protein